MSFDGGSGYSPVTLFSLFGDSIVDDEDSFVVSSKHSSSKSSKKATSKFAKNIIMQVSRPDIYADRYQSLSFDWSSRRNSLPLKAVIPTEPKELNSSSADAFDNKKRKSERDSAKEPLLRTKSMREFNVHKKLPKRYEEEKIRVKALQEEYIKEQKRKKYLAKKITVTDKDGHPVEWTEEGRRVLEGQACNFPIKKKVIVSPSPSIQPEIKITPSNTQRPYKVPPLVEQSMRDFVLGQREAIIKV